MIFDLIFALIFKTVESLLRKYGYKVSTACNGRDAVRSLEASRKPGARPVDLVLTDVLMPEVSGFELIHEVMHGDLFSDIPVVSPQSGAPAAGRTSICSLLALFLHEMLIKGTGGAQGLNRAEQQAAALSQTATTSLLHLASVSMHSDAWRATAWAMPSAAQPRQGPGD